MGMTRGVACAGFIAASSAAFLIAWQAHLSAGQQANVAEWCTNAHAFHEVALLENFDGARVDEVVG